MDYKPGGYSWLAVAPETKEEEQIEKIEDEIYALRKALKQTGKADLLNHILILEEQIKKIKNKH